MQDLDRQEQIELDTMNLIQNERNNMLMLKEEVRELKTNMLKEFQEARKDINNIIKEQNQVNKSAEETHKLIIGSMMDMKNDRNELQQGQRKERNIINNQAISIEKMKGEINNLGALILGMFAKVDELIKKLAGNNETKTGKVTQAK
jgi:hypothetical protein